MSWFNKAVNVVKGAWQDFTGQTAWQQQAEYNTPANQMARYRDAGLNPNLIYGSGQASAGNMTSAPDYQTKFSKALQVLDLFKGIADIKKQSDESKLDKARTVAAIEHQKDVLDFQKKQAIIDTMFKDKDFGLRSSEFEWKKGQSRQEYLLKKAAQTLAQDKFDWERGHIDKYGTKPGTSIDYVNMLFSNLLGKPTTDVGTDTGNILNNGFADAFGLLGDIGNMGYMTKVAIKKMVKSALDDMVGGFAGQGYRR